MRQRIIMAGMCCFCALFTNPAAAQRGNEFALSFTSGFAGDGFDYPFSIGPSVSSGNGIRPGQFFIPDNPAGSSISVDYQGANLAFFDANNLLTRPSSRITNEAFWTDPRLFTNTSNNFSLSSLGFAVEVFDPESVSTLGFDLAVASVAAPLPDALSFQIQFGIEGPVDDSGPPEDEELFFFGDISLIDDSSSSEFIVEVGTFQTLGSPFGGRDARVEFDLESLYSEAFSQGPSGGVGGGDFSSFAGPIFIDIDTRPLDNSNGISVNQVAIDNLSINGGVRSDARAEPEIVNGPTPGPFNPTTFQLTGPPNANVVNVPATTQSGPIGLSVTSGPFTDPGDFRVTLYTPGNANVSGLSEVTFGFGPTVAALLATDAPESELLDLTGEIVLTLTADPEQAAVLPVVFETEALIDSELAELLANVFFAAEESGDPLTVGEALELGLPIITGVSEALSESAAYFAGVSASDFLGLLSADAVDLIVGTQGAAFTPSYNSLGELTGGRVSSFLVTDRSGTYNATVRVAAIPEPTSLALLGFTGFVFFTRRRRLGQASS